MSDVKWIKIVTDMFEDSKIEYIRDLPEGDSIIVTWFQMLTIAGKSNMDGYLMVSDDIPYTEQFLASKLKRDPVFFQYALNTLCKLKMVNIEDGPFHITNWEKHQNIDGMEKIRLQNRERKRQQRERERQVLLLESQGSHVTVTEEVTQCHALELELELELDNKKTIVDSDECDEAFDLMYSLYPYKKGSKAKAVSKWKTLWKNKKIDMDKVIEGTKAYVRFVEHKRKKRDYPYKNIDTYVNQQHWNDDHSIEPEINIGTHQKQNRMSMPFGDGYEGDI